MVTRWSSGIKWTFFFFLELPFVSMETELSLLFSFSVKLFLLKTYSLLLVSILGCKISNASIFLSIIASPWWKVQADICDFVQVSWCNSHIKSTSVHCKSSSEQELSKTMKSSQSEPESLKVESSEVARLEVSEWLILKQIFMLTSWPFWL